jgi:hypothetical protein
MEKIIDNIYVGSDEDDSYASSRGWAILCVCKDGPHSHRSMLGYTERAAPKDKNYFFVEEGNRMALNVIDADDPHKIRSEAINPGLEFVKKHYDAGDKVLIHCNRGHSRGPTTALMFLRLIGEMPYNFAKSVKVFKGLYPKYDPTQGMKIFAQKNWNELSMIGKTSNV